MLVLVAAPWCPGYGRGEGGSIEERLAGKEPFASLCKFSTFRHSCSPGTTYFYLGMVSLGGEVGGKSLLCNPARL